MEPSWDHVGPLSCVYPTQDSGVGVALSGMLVSVEE